MSHVAALCCFWQKEKKWLPLVGKLACHHRVPIPSQPTCQCAKSLLPPPPLCFCHCRFHYHHHHRWERIAGELTIVSRNNNSKNPPPPSTHSYNRNTLNSLEFPKPLRILHLLRPTPLTLQTQIAITEILIPKIAIHLSMKVPLPTATTPITST